MIRRFLFLALALQRRAQRLSHAHARHGGRFARNASSTWLLFAVMLLPALPAEAQARERCFPQTGHCISGAIRTYWERNGGLPVFGYPISPVTQQYIGDWQGPAQWFERDRLEDHSNQGLGVLAGRLGAQLLELQEHGTER